MMHSDATMNTLLRLRTSELNAARAKVAELEREREMLLEQLQQLTARCAALAGTG